MNSVHTGNLSREKIQKLLATVSSRSNEDKTKIEAVDYDWRQPHYFGSEQLIKLDELTKEAAQEMAERFARFCNNDFNVKIVSATEHFAAELRNQDQSGRAYYLTFGSSQGRQYGLICIPAQTAFIWATQLLGDSESNEDSERDLSQLKESLLLDIASALIEAFFSRCENCDVKPGQSLDKKSLPLEMKDTDALCKITFQVRKTDQENGAEAYILILCSELEPFVGRTSKAADKTSAADNSKVILEHIQPIQVSIRARLASTVLTFEQVLNLRPDDILLLNKRIDEPLELLLDGRTVFYGWPAKSAGRHAVVIAAEAKNTKQALGNPVPF
jgi:flagellar motor switch protein FliM